MKDLGHYAAVFQSYLGAKLRSRETEVALLSPTVKMIQGLRKVRLNVDMRQKERGGWRD